MTARPHEKGEDPPAAEPLDPEFVRMIQESLDDPRPSFPADEAFAELKARHEARLRHDGLASVPLSHRTGLLHPRRALDFSGGGAKARRSEIACLLRAFAPLRLLFEDGASGANERVASVRPTV
ncbi:MAG: hypothetical protein ABWX67_03300 [Allosphingosinicella sp.]